MSDKFDITKWSLRSVGTIPTVSRPKRPFIKPKVNPTVKFIRAPLPYTWITSAAKLAGKSLHAAMAIRYLDGFDQSGTVKLTHRILKDFGISVKASYDVLTRMEKAGLISVKRHKGRSPIITIIGRIPNSDVIPPSEKGTARTLRGDTSDPVIDV